MKRVLVKQIALKSISVLLIFLPLYLLLGAMIPQAFKPAQVAVPEVTARLGRVWDEGGGGSVPDAVRAIGDSRDALNLRIALMREARERLDISYYSVSNLSAGDAFLSEMIQAADRGVEVRLMIDGKMGKLLTKTKRALAAHPHITVANYNPVNILKPWDFNEVMHDKFMIVDGRYAILGGRNIEPAYFDVAEDCVMPKLDWDILMVKTDPDAAPERSIVDTIAGYNELLWQSPKAKTVKANARSLENLREIHEDAAVFRADHPEYYTHDLAYYTADLIRPERIKLIHNPLNSGRKEPWVFQSVAELASEAEESIFIQTPYATASPFILDFMSRSAATAPTAVMTNSFASALNLPAFSNYAYQKGQFVDTGVKLHEFQGDRSLHGKAYQFDGKITLIGSYNLDSRSTHMTTETMVVVDSEPFAEHFKEQRDRILDESLVVGKDVEYLPSETVTEKSVAPTKMTLYMLGYILLRPFQYFL